LIAAHSCSRSGDDHGWSTRRTTISPTSQTLSWPCRPERTNSARCRSLTRRVTDFISSVCPMLSKDPDKSGGPVKARMGMPPAMGGHPRCLGNRPAWIRAGLLGSSHSPGIGRSRPCHHASEKTLEAATNVRSKEAPLSLSFPDLVTVQVIPVQDEGARARNRFSLCATACRITSVGRRS
jgi:hypothetical protein